MDPHEHPVHVRLDREGREEDSMDSVETMETPLPFQMTRATKASQVLPDLVVMFTMHPADVSAEVLAPQVPFLNLIGVASMGFSFGVSVT